LYLRRSVPIWIALFAAIASCALAQSKVTVDPNAGIAAETSASVQADSRLSQKITYNSGYTTLRSVTEQLQKMSGVGIHCGQDASNWQVRDLPLVVCARDVPLGALLRAVTDSTHCIFGSDRIGNSAQKSYRIFRRAREENEIKTLLDASYAARMATIDWAWDAATAYGKMPAQADVPRELWIACKLIASLGPDSKQKMLTGEKFKFPASEPAYAGEIKALVDVYVLQAQARGIEYSPVKTLTPEQIASSCVEIKLLDTGPEGVSHIEVNLGPICWGPGGFYLEEQRMRLASVKGVGAPPQSVSAAVPSPDEDMGNPNMHYITPRELATHALPSLNAAIDLDPPAAPGKPTFSDFVEKLSQASGYSVVCEDFRSHLSPDLQAISFAYGKNRTVCDALNMASGYRWFVDEANKLIVGWADSDFMGTRWRQNHRNLVSEDYLKQLEAKLNGEGVELDEVASFANIDESTFRAFTQRPGLLALDHARPIIDRAYWQLYAYLSPEDKARARTADGVALSKYDAKEIKAFCDEQRKQNTIRMCSLFKSLEQRTTWEEQMKRKDAVVSDPTLISTLVLRVKQKPASTRVIWSDSHYPKQSIPKALNLHVYDMEIEYKKDDQTYTVPMKAPEVAFPIYSPEREAEIIKASGQ